MLTFVHTTQMMERSYTILRQQKFRIFVGFKFLLCLLLIIPIFSFAETSPNDDTELPEQFSGVIYVSNSAVLYGADQMHIATEKDISGKKIVTTAKPAVKAVVISKDAIKQEKKIKEEKFKKEFPPVKAKSYLNNSSTDSSLLAAKQLVNSQATISIPSPQKQVLNAAVVDLLKNISIDSQLVKQKFYTSISYLQFKKYLDSSLRGPPQYL